ncbi:MAG: hypothetical protein QG623_490 [Patescibacteria group bacterium]|nr:hypothetical protein [Patescibacteria group bacterium]
MEQTRSQSDETWDSEVERYKVLTPEEKLAHDEELEKMKRAGWNTVGFTNTEALISSSIDPTSTIEGGVNLGENVQVGRFANIRKGAKIENQVRIGDFAEVGNQAIMEDFSHALNEALVKPREIIPKSGVRPNQMHNIV